MHDDGIVDSEFLGDSDETHMMIVLPVYIIYLLQLTCNPITTPLRDVVEMARTARNFVSIQLTIDNLYAPHPSLGAAFVVNRRENVLLILCKLRRALV